MKEFALICLALGAMIWYRRALRHRVNAITEAPATDKIEPPIQLTIWETSASCDVDIRDGRTGHRVLWSVSAFADQDEAEEVLAYVVRQIKSKNVNVRIGR